MCGSRSSPGGRLHISWRSRSFRPGHSARKSVRLKQKQIKVRGWLCRLLLGGRKSSSSSVRSRSRGVRANSTGVDRSEQVHRHEPGSLWLRADLSHPGVSASVYYHRATGARSDRSVEDERLLELIREKHETNYLVFGHRRMWKALDCRSEPVTRCTVQRLMRRSGLAGAKRRGAGRGGAPRLAILRCRSARTSSALT